MNSSDNSLFARIGVGLVTVVTVAMICALFAANMDQGGKLPAGSFDLSGTWDFHNGSLHHDARDFSEKVEVPSPLGGQLKGTLAEEFWYRKKFQLPENLNHADLEIFLGTIKGEHQVYWNGDRIGSGGKLVIGSYQIPESASQAGSIELLIKVKTPEHLFPGIVHKFPIGINHSKSFESLKESYLFESGAKPLMLATFKFGLFLLFATLFLILPRRREYFSFSFFVLFSSCAAALSSRYVPFYFEYYLRNEISFLFTTLTFSSIPWVAADVLRLRGKQEILAKTYGLVCGLIFFTAVLWIDSRENEIALFQLSGRYLPLLVGLPSIFGCFWIGRILPVVLRHRRIQVFSFASFLFLGTVAWWANSGTLFSFSYIPYPELWDMGLFAGLAASATMDMRFASRRSERADKVIPKWFSGFLASGIDQVTLELPMVAIAVDTVGYTRILSELDTAGKSQLHANIRARMAPVVEKFGAQKLSDRGDGALLAWDLSGTEEDRRDQIRAAVAAAEFLVTESANSVGVKFRVGMAAGLVRGELKGSEISFLGEPLNAASRLEAAAKPGTVLLHDSVVAYLDPASIAHEWIQIDVKGVAYRAVSLKKAS